MIYLACIVGGAVVVLAGTILLAEYCGRCIARILTHSPEDK